MSSKEVLGLCLSLAEIIPAGIQSFIPKEGELQKSDRPAQATVTPEWGAGIVSAQPQVLPCHPGIDSTLAWSIGVPRPLPCFAFFFLLVCRSFIHFHALSEHLHVWISQPASVLPSLLNSRLCLGCV